MSAGAGRFAAAAKYVSAAFRRGKLTARPVRRNGPGRAVRALIRPCAGAKANANRARKWPEILQLRPLDAARLAA